MPQLVMLSGKGGTGKTSLSAGLAHLAFRDNPQAPPILVDADVDAANLELLLEANHLQEEPFPGSPVALIDQTGCTACGRCREVCRFEAVIKGGDGNSFEIDPLACEGCAACLYECPEGAISQQERQAGEWYISETRFGQLFHAHLYPAQENSGKLVAHIKEQARQTRERAGAGWTLVDGPPGIGCPVIAAISGADAVLAVAEPSLAGIHDLARVLDTADYFQVPVTICINKADIYPEGTREIIKLAQEREHSLVGDIPYDLDVARAMTAGQPVTEFAPGSGAAKAVANIWQRISHFLLEQQEANDLSEL